MLRVGRWLFGRKEADEVAAVIDAEKPDNKEHVDLVHFAGKHDVVEIERGDHESLQGSTNDGSVGSGLVCSICGEERATAFCGSITKHGMCGTCLHGYITSTLGDRTIFLECIVCPQLGCDAHMARDDAASVLSSNEIAAISKRAEESDKLVAKAVHDDDQTQRVVDRTTNRCPKCRVPIEKAMGCRHIRCTMCNAGFWFGCNCVYPGPCPHGDMFQTVSGDALEALNTTGVSTLTPRPGAFNSLLGWDFGPAIHDWDFDPDIPDGWLDPAVTLRPWEFAPVAAALNQPTGRSVVDVQQNMGMFLAERGVLPAVVVEVTRLLQLLRERPDRILEVDAQFLRLESEHFIRVARQRYPPSGPPMPWLSRSSGIHEPPSSRRQRHHLSSSFSANSDLDNDGNVSDVSEGEIEMPVSKSHRKSSSVVGKLGGRGVRALKRNMEMFLATRGGVPDQLDNLAEVTRLLQTLADHSDQVLDVHAQFRRIRNEQRRRRRSPPAAPSVDRQPRPPRYSSGAVARSSSASPPRSTFSDPHFGDFPYGIPANARFLAREGRLGSTIAPAFRPPVGFTSHMRRSFGHRHAALPSPPRPRVSFDERPPTSEMRSAARPQLARAPASILRSSPSVMRELAVPSLSPIRNERSRNEAAETLCFLHDPSRRRRESDTSPPQRNVKRLRRSEHESMTGAAAAAANSSAEGERRVRFRGPEGTMAMREAGRLASNSAHSPVNLASDSDSSSNSDSDSSVQEVPPPASERQSLRHKAAAFRMNPSLDMQPPLRLASSVGSSFSGFGTGVPHFLGSEEYRVDALPYGDISRRYETDTMFNTSMRPPPPRPPPFSAAMSRPANGPTARSVSDAFHAREDSLRRLGRDFSGSSEL